MLGKESPRWSFHEGLHGNYHVISWRGHEGKVKALELREGGAKKTWWHEIAWTEAKERNMQSYELAERTRDPVKRACDQ